MTVAQPALANREALTDPERARLGGMAAGVVSLNGGRVGDVSRIETSRGHFIKERKKGMKAALVHQRYFHFLAAQRLRCGQSSKTGPNDHNLVHRNHLSANVRNRLF